MWTPRIIDGVDLAFHQGRDEGDVARQPVRLGNDEASPVLLRRGDRLLQLGAISTLGIGAMAWQEPL